MQTPVVLEADELRISAELTGLKKSLSVKNNILWL